MVSSKHLVLWYAGIVIFGFVVLNQLLPEGRLAEVFAGTTSTSSATIAGGANNTPSVTNVVVNGGSAITLIANATKTVTVSFTVTDLDGCSQVFFNSGNVTTTLFRSGVSSTCAVGNPSTNLNTLNCYMVATTTNNCPSATSTTTSANATSTFEVWYFADATDASSSYSGENWQSFVIAQDASTTNSTTSAGVELNTLLALTSVTSSINYGSVNANANTGATNQTAGIKNAGNASTTLNINGTAMTSGANSISTSSQHYATNTFTYGGAEASLQEAATAVTGFLIPRPPLTSWATTTPLPTAIYAHASVANNGYLYTVGGNDGSITSTVRFAPINATGSLGTWATTTPLPTSTGYFASVVNNGYIYTTGGLPNDGITSSVFFAPINSTGSIGAWSSTTALPAGAYRHTSVAYNGYVYSIGGNDAAIRTTTVNFAPINSTGSIGSWTSTAALPSPIERHTSVVYNGYLYTIGGFSNAGQTSTVQFAPINSTGSLGSWTMTTALPGNVYEHASVVNNGVVYTIGGLDSTETSTVLFAPVNAGGSLGSWSRTTPLPTGTRRHAAAVYNGIVYSIAGTTNNVNTSTIYYTSFASRNTYWGTAVSASTPTGTYSGVNTFTAVFSP